MPGIPATQLLTSLPASRMAAILDVFLSVLKSDPTLSALPLKVVTYQDGYDESDKPKKEPDLGELPYLRLSLGGSSMKWETEHEHIATFPIEMTMFTAGLHQNDILNLAEAVIHALYPQDAAQRTKVFDQFHAMPGLYRGGFKKGLGLSQIGMSSHGLAAKLTFLADIVILT
jgi:hypothetical protein